MKLLTDPCMVLTNTNQGAIHSFDMNAREFDVVETRHFIMLTERGSNREFRIPVSDAILVGGIGTDWRTGDIVKLSAEQQETLAKLDARCRAMSDDAVVGQNKLHARLGCLSWIVLLVVIGALIVWWLKK